MDTASGPSLGRFGSRAVGFAAFAIAAFGLSGAVNADDRPNFIVVIADDMGWSDCGVYGHPNVCSPNID